jgi:phosphoglycerate dehydrogenase-like enzyme
LTIRGTLQGCQTDYRVVIIFASRKARTIKIVAVVEQSLIDCLSKRRIGEPAVDVFDVEPLPAGPPFRAMDSVVATPHVGYMTRNLYRTFYGDTIANIAKRLESRN